MAQYEDHSNHTNVPREPVRESTGTGTGTMAFIIGGLVVAVGIIAWFLMGGETDNSVTTVPADGGEASITIENTPSAAPADDGTETAPAGDAAPADEPAN